MRIHEEIAEFLHSSEQRVVDHHTLADMIKATHKNTNGRILDVTTEKLHSVITRARRYMESKYRCTIWNIRNVGFRITTPQELALFTAQSVRRTIQMADRTIRLTHIVDRKMMPQALQFVFADSEKKIKSLGRHGKRFMRTFVDYIDEQKKIGGK